MVQNYGGVEGLDEKKLICSDELVIRSDELGLFTV